MGEFAQVNRRPTGQQATVTANRAWWDAEAGSYYAEHGDFLGDAELTWGPEGWTEEELGLLGEIGPGTTVLEIGAGAAQGSRWVHQRGAAAVASDLSRRMLATAASIDAARPTSVPLVHCDAARLPLAERCVDVVFTAYGVMPFVADVSLVMREVARVLRSEGRFVFSTTHPIRWCFPDVPGDEGLAASQPYWDRRPYVEVDRDGEVMYVEHHRTVGDWVREIVAAGLVLVDIVEPEWPTRNEQVWGGWSPTRGRILPGTAIFVATLP